MPTEAEMRADLARAMGWRPTIVFSDGARNGQQLSKPPNPFTDPAAMRALVEWIDADDERWGRFDTALLEALIVAGKWPGPGARDNEHLSLGEQYRRAFLAAPLPIIARAAWEAIQEGK